MKNIKKMFALLIAMVMVLGMSTSVFAAVTTDSGKGGSASIQITLPTDNAGTDQAITYRVYKVFDATQNGSAISYKIDAANGTLSAAMTTAGFFVDDGGNVHYGTFTADPDPLPAGQTPGTYFVGGVRGTITDNGTLDQAALDAIAAYAVDQIGTTGFTAKPSDGTLTITGLEYGYYYITTTTGTVVTVDSTKPNAEVQDKNTIPTPPVKTIVEDFEGSVDDAGKNAIAQVGTNVPFSVDIVKVKGATNYVFHDTMGAGLTYNNDVAVSVGGSTVTASSTINTTADSETFITTTASGDTVTVTFDNDWLAALADNTTITITYSAQVNSDALSIDYVNNTATLGYGDDYTTEEDEVKVYNAKFTVTKQDGDGAALPGAGFVILNSAGKYYKLNPKASADDPATVGINEAAGPYVTWVDSIDDATEYTSDNAGAVKAFTGLANGTYTLHEKTVPAGYNQAADSKFTIAEDDYTKANLEQASTVVNEAGSVLPSTGGIGTTIFYVVGSILLVGTGVVLVTRKRMSAEK